MNDENTLLNPEFNSLWEIIPFTVIMSKALHFIILILWRREDLGPSCSDISEVWEQNTSGNQLIVPTLPFPFSIDSSKSNEENVFVSTTFSPLTYIAQQCWQHIVRFHMKFKKSTEIFHIFNEMNSIVLILYFSYSLQWQSL